MDGNQTQKPGRRPDEMPADPALDVTRQAADVILQAQARVLVAARQLGLLKVALPDIVRQLPSRLPELTVRDRQADLAFELADGSILQVEPQVAAGTRADLSRWLEYASRLVERYDVAVHTVILYGPGVARAPDRMGGGSLRYRVWNVYLGRWDGPGELGQLERLLGAGGELAGPALVRLVLSGFMGPRRADRVATAMRAAKLAGAVRDPALRELARAAAFGFAARGAVADQLARLKEALRMISPLTEAIFADGKAEGKAEGQAESLALVLQLRFRDVPAELLGRVRAETDPAKLQRWLAWAVTAPTLGGWREALGE